MDASVFESGNYGLDGLYKCFAFDSGERAPVIPQWFFPSFEPLPVVREVSFNKIECVPINIARLFKGMVLPVACPIEFQSLANEIATLVNERRFIKMEKVGGIGSFVVLQAVEPVTPEDHDGYHIQAVIKGTHWQKGASEYVCLTQPRETDSHITGKQLIDHFASGGVLFARSRNCLITPKML